MIFKIVFIAMLQIFIFQSAVAFDDIIKLITDIGKAAFTPPGYHNHDSSSDDLGKVNKNKEPSITETEALDIFNSRQQKSISLC